MNDFNDFGQKLREIISRHACLGIEEAREIISEINNFLYTTHSNIGIINVNGKAFNYLSDFHKFWHKHHREILDCKIDDTQCELVADALHNIHGLTNGGAFHEIYDMEGLSPEEVCRIRLLTANQDFRTSLNFSDLANVYKTDPSIFDENFIYKTPDRFLGDIHVNKLSQTDKRIKYAQNIAKFVIEHNSSPYELIHKYNSDIKRLREALKSANAGYGNKKTDMFIRDMVVLGIWNNVNNFECINVASDVNTIRVALRTGIVSTKIPLLTSFMDIFSYQYSYIDEMNTLAWRRVWEIWTRKYPGDNIASPCLIDYFVYNVVGKQFCKKILAHYKCSRHNHTFRWHSTQNKTCQVCRQINKTVRVPAFLLDTSLPCEHPDGYIAIQNSEFVKKLPENKKINSCPFNCICKGRIKYNEPKSISIMGRTGWETAYTQTGEGGGGLMA